MTFSICTKNFLLHLELGREDKSISDLEFELSLFGIGGNIGWEKGELPFVGFWLRRR